MKSFLFVFAFLLFGFNYGFAQKERKPGTIPNDAARYVPEDRSGGGGSTSSGKVQVEEVVIKPNPNTGGGGTVQTTDKTTNNGNGNLPGGKTTKKTSKTTPSKGKETGKKKNIVTECYKGNIGKFVGCVVVQTVVAEATTEFWDWASEMIKEHFYSDANTPNVFKGEMVIINQSGKKETVIVSITHSSSPKGSVYSVSIIDETGTEHAGRTNPMTDTN